MISIFFYCSSPYVGYTLKKADYINKEMKNVSEKDMTAIGYKLFNSSGSFMVLGKFDGRKYFHTRQSQSENFDEQNRRIYENVAFVGENIQDEKVIDKIAMYVLFNEKIFYRKMADMTILLDDGFTIDFNKLLAFVNEIDKAKIVFDSSNNNAVKFYNDIMKCCDKEISFVITESTWSYFIKQVGFDFNESVLYKLSLQDAELLTKDSIVKLDNEIKSTDNSSHFPPASQDSNVAETKNETDDKIISFERDEEIRKLKQDINNICAERNDLKSEIKALNKKINFLTKENTNLMEEQKTLKIKNIIKGVIGTALAVLIIHILKWIF